MAPYKFLYLYLNIVADCPKRSVRLSVKVTSCQLRTCCGWDHRRKCLWRRRTILEPVWTWKYQWEVLKGTAVNWPARRSLWHLIKTIRSWWRSRWESAHFCFILPRLYCVFNSVCLCQVPGNAYTFQKGLQQYAVLQAHFPQKLLEKQVLLTFQSGHIVIQTDKTIYTPDSMGGMLIFIIMASGNVFRIDWIMFIFLQCITGFFHSVQACHRLLKVESVLRSW